jgi:hypothetical protein
MLYFSLEKKIHEFNNIDNDCFGEKYLNEK